MSTVLLFALALAAAPVSEADALFEQGRAAMKSNDLAKACPAFERSHQLQPALGTLLNLATCYEKQGKFASAWVRFNEAVAWAGRTHEVDREKYARERATATKKRVSWLALTSAAPVDVSVDNAVPVSVSPQSPVSVPSDVGVHEIVARSPGAAPWTKTVTLDKEATTVAVAIPSLNAETPPVTTNTTPSSGGSSTTFAASTDAPPPPPLVVATESNSNTSGTVGVGLLVGGAAVAVVGAVGLGWSYSTYGQLQNQRAGATQTGEPVSRGTFDTLTWVYPASWIAVGVGAAAAVSGVVLAATGTKSTVTVAPSVGANGGGMILSGSF